MILSNNGIVTSAIIRKDDPIWVYKKASPLIYEQYFYYLDLSTGCTNVYHLHKYLPSASILLLPIHGR